jgi:uncharacterized protein (TIGR02231 family)
MKMKIILFGAFLLIFGQVQSQNIPEKKVSTEISSATIYLSGAEIIRNKSITLAKGKTQIIFDGLSPKINPKSIRITTDKTIDLLGISNKINYLAKEEHGPEIKRLNDSLEIVKNELQTIADKTDAFSTEKQLLLKNISLGGTNNGVNITELKQASDFYRLKITEINSKISQLNQQKEKLNLGYQRIVSQLNEMNSNAGYTRSEISILVSCDAPVTGNFELKYLVDGAGWSPAYDIKAFDINEPVTLEYRAKVYNNTDINWKDLKIKLSTADPNLSVTKPILNPWYLRYQTYNYNSNMFKGKEGYIQNQISDERNLSVQQEAFSELNEDIVISGDFSEATVPELSAEFEITKSYSIPSDDKPYLVDISEHQLPANYQHFAVTKLDRDVFLIAQITGWQDLNLIEGPANVYYSGTYLGQSFINTRNVKDTLDLSLGRDSKVIVTRTKLKEFSSSQFVGTKKKETMTYQLTAKNNRKSDVTIEILDQLPISQTDEIEVKAIELSGAEQNLSTGELKWKYTLKPGESKTIKLSYYIKYPENKQLEIEQRKSKQVRYF